MSATQTTKEENLSNALHCNRCNSILPSYAIFCGKCGERLQKSVGEVELPWLWPVIIILSAVAAGLTTRIYTATAVRLIIVMWFLFVCPGMMLVRFFRLKEAAVEWILALALSFAINAIVAAVLLYAGKWSPTGILIIMIGLSVGGAIMQLARIVIYQVSTRASADNHRRPQFTLTLPLQALKLPLVAHLPILLATLMIGLTVVASIWSPVYRALSTSRGSALPFTSPTRSSSVSTTTATTTPSSIVDTVIVMDNVNQISDYDPQGDRYMAAQLFVGLASIGDRIGIVRITSSLTPAKILNLWNIKNSSDKELVKSKLSGAFLGPVDPNPTAYFTPALQMAGNMLGQEPATDRKYILIITDAVAFSGDQNTCSGSPDIFHNWFCIVDAMERQGISVVLLGFTKPGNATELPPAKQYIEARGGTVLQVTDGVNLVKYLTQAYSKLLTPIR